MTEPSRERTTGWIGTRGSKAAFIAALIFVPVAWIACATLPWRFGDLTKSGQFGDTFGAVNALFSGLALVGVAYAIALQHEELEIARKEARDSDIARRDAEKALSQQIDAMLATAKLNAASSIIQANNSIATLATNEATKGRWREINQIRIYRQYMVSYLSNLSKSATEQLALVFDHCMSLIAETEASWREAVMEKPEIKSGLDRVYTLRDELKWARHHPKVAETPLSASLRDSIDRLDSVLNEGVQFDSVESYRSEIATTFQELKRLFGLALPTT